MSRLPIEIKEKALRLRKRGYSIKEIAKKLNIAQSTSSVWVRDIELDRKAQDRLLKRNLMSHYKTSLRWKKKRIEEDKVYRSRALPVIDKTKKDLYHFKLYCSLLYWCEGGKGYREAVGFTNSDPVLIEAFIKLFRKSFDLDESKFRVVMHLHAYHNERKQKKFWSVLTSIPEKQFLKTFQKPNTGKRIKEGYPGCISLYYYDCKIAREIKALYKVFSEQMGA